MMPHLRNAIILTLGIALPGWSQAFPSTCNPPDSATAPGWFWSPAAFDRSNLFGFPFSGTVAAAARRPLSAALIERSPGRYYLGMVTLTEYGPALPEWSILTLRRPTAKELTDQAPGESPAAQAAFLVGEMTSDSMRPSTLNGPVEALIRSDGLEIALGLGLFGEDGPPRLQTIGWNAKTTSGWWMPGSSIVPPPHGYFCLVRTAPPN